MSYLFFWVFNIGFVYLFPLAFGFMGNYPSHPYTATFALLLGMIGWLIFIYKLFYSGFIQPYKDRDTALAIRASGKSVQAEIIQIISSVDTPEGRDMVVSVRFANLAGNMIKAQFEFSDIKTHLRRYELGKFISLRLNTVANSKIPWMIDSGEILIRKLKRRWMFIFAAVYAVGLFYYYHTTYSNGMGWRWLAVYNPWVIVPYLGLLLNFGLNTLLRALVGQYSDRVTNDILLNGIRTTGEITSASQTGMSVNEQPELKLTIRFTDAKGQIQQVEKKQIVPLIELQDYREGDIEILYLPDKPEELYILTKEFVKDL
ncbi:MAG: hypothetical protein Q4G54_01775 [Pelistega sp.]|nr:hypothetical protein [Pelistega sp.]